MTPAALAMALLLAAVVAGYGAWRLPRLRQLLAGLVLGLTAAALALLRSRRIEPPPPPEYVAALDGRTEEDLAILADGDAYDLADAANAGRRSTRRGKLRLDAERRR